MSSLYPCSLHLLTRFIHSFAHSLTHCLGSCIYTLVVATICEIASNREDSASWKTYPKRITRDEPRARLESELAEPTAVTQPDELALVRRPDLLLDATGIKQDTFAVQSRVRTVHLPWNKNNKSCKNNNIDNNNTTQTYTIIVCEGG